MPTSLDTLCGVLGVEGAWLQTADGETLLLAGSRGLNPAIESALTGLGQRAALRQAVLGRGETVTLPDLAARRATAPAAFRQAGFRWLVAAPLMTHRAGGILGVASKHRKTYDRDLPSLIRVVAGMVGGALQKARLASRKPEPDSPPCEPLPRVPLVTKAAPPPREDAFFQRHKRRMALFRHEHPEPQL